jgi:hypothetical protein
MFGMYDGLSEEMGCRWRLVGGNMEEMEAYGGVVFVRKLYDNCFENRMALLDSNT